MFQVITLFVATTIKFRANFTSVHNDETFEWNSELYEIERINHKVGIEFEFGTKKFET